MLPTSAVALRAMSTIFPGLSSSPSFLFFLLFLSLLPLLHPTLLSFSTQSLSLPSSPFPPLLPSSHPSLPLSHLLFLSYLSCDSVSCDCDISVSVCDTTSELFALLLSPPSTEVRVLNVVLEEDRIP